MLNKIARFIAQNGLLTHEGRHIVALSGGADSVALLLILRQLDYQVEAAHCNFHLRGEESDRDEAFVRELCRAKDIPLHLAHFDTRTYAEVHRVSIEMAARELRYRYFEQLRQDIEAETICVAHHQNDAVETLLMNLMHGTGIHGLTGIRARNGNVVRPMLCVSRQDILNFLQQERQDYVTDSTNLEDNALRNKIRLNLIPMMQQIIPNSSENISRTANRLLEAERVFKQAMESQISNLVRVSDEGGWGSTASVNIQALQQLPSPEYFLFEWLSPFGFNPSQIGQIASHLDSQSGKEYSTASHILFVDRSELLLSPRQHPLQPMRIPETGTYIYQDGFRYVFEVIRDVTISKSADCITIDKEKVNFPLMIRPTQSADRFQPYGMEGSKLVSDYLTDRKVSLPVKRRQLVVTDSLGEIIWLVGRRTDDRYKVTPATSLVLRITKSHAFFEKRPT